MTRDPQFEGSRNATGVGPKPITGWQMTPAARPGFAKVIEDVTDERRRIGAKWEDPNRRPLAVHDGFPVDARLPVLVEEVGEVAAALQGDGNLRDELVQVAAVACRWIEALDECREEMRYV